MGQRLSVEKFSSVGEEEFTQTCSSGTRMFLYIRYVSYMYYTVCKSHFNLKDTCSMCYSYVKQYSFGVLLVVTVRLRDHELLVFWNQGIKNSG